jgi:hypothetical protein
MHMKTTSVLASARASGVAALVVLLSGCAARAGALPGAPAADPAALEAELRAATLPSSPQQANFTWTLDEAGSRVSGRGAVRYIAPERLRLDLFGPRGESYLAAALVGEDYRLPPGAASGPPLPSASLLWAALGVARPPAGAVLEGATTADGRIYLQYRDAAGDQFRVQAQRGAGGLRLEKVERIGPSGVLETVQLDYSPEGRLRQTRYRDWSAYRDLVLQTETITDVPSFPETIWSPGAAGR